MEPRRRRLRLHLDGRTLEVALWEWSPAGADSRSLLYLHGLGCSKEDGLGALAAPALANIHVAAFDFPGCGESPYPHSGGLACEHLAALAERFLVELGMKQPLVVGHSLGGVVALLLAERTGVCARGLVTIEGNLAAEDSTLSRRTASLTSPGGARALLRETADLCRASNLPGYPEYGEALARRLRASAFYDYGRSLVTLSDDGDLLARFLALRIPRLLVIGERSRVPSYVGVLERAAVPVAVIARAAHFPAWSNPRALWGTVAAFLRTPDHAEHT